MRLEAANLAELPDDGRLAEAVLRLVGALAPERIYLFGSRARGDATEESDYDLLIVMPGPEAQHYQSAQRAYKALGDLPISVDVLVWTRDQFEEMVPVVASLPSTIMREGRLLYAA